MLRFDFVCCIMSTPSTSLHSLPFIQQDVCYQMDLESTLQARLIPAVTIQRVLRAGARPSRAAL